MRTSGDSRGGDDAISLPSGFKYFIGVSALFIAVCSAFFSVRGLGLLFAGSATAVMIMASSLEVGKLVAASFLYRYWDVINRPLRVYLTIAVLLLIGITSLGNYGYLARAYERTHTRVATLEDQVAMLEKENADTQRQIDASRGQLTTSLGSLQQRITAANTSLDQALARLQEQRKAAQDRRDHDLSALSQQLAGRNETLTKAIATEDALIAGLNDQVAVLDRAVDAYTKQGGPGLFKTDSIRKGQELREKQAKERTALADQIAEHRTRQEQLRTEAATNTGASDKDIAAVRQRFDTEVATLDAEEKELRKAQVDTIAQIEQQMTGLQTPNQTAAVGSAKIDALYQRLHARNDEIRHLREQIAATDIGSYRFVARAFTAPADDVVKWLTLVLVLVFDPLAVCLAVGFNVALLRDRRRSPLTAPTVATPSTLPRPRLATWGLSLFLLAFGAGALAVGAHWMLNSYRHKANTPHAQLIPASSFAVATLRPGQLQDSELLTGWLATLPGKATANALTQVLQSGFDGLADVYVFAKFPEKQPLNQESPVMLAGLAARVTDAAAAEAALGRLADQISAGLRKTSDNAPTPAKGRAMIRYGSGRYLDPEGGFFSFGLANDTAVLLVELEGDAKAPLVETEMQACLTAHPEGEALPERALARDGVASVWFDAGRFFNHLPKNSPAQVRYQQLQRYLDFDLQLKVKPVDLEHVMITADYVYQNDRFKDRQQPTALQVMAGLGTGLETGLGGQLMDRCADTLDYDSLIERLRTTLGGATKSGTQDVLVEKSYESDRQAQFVVSARYAPTANAPVASAR